MMWDDALAGPPRDHPEPTRLMSQLYRPLPPAEELARELCYDPETGILLRISRRRGRYSKFFPVTPPRPVGCVDGWGYLRCDLYGMSNVPISRVIWRLHTGDDPGQHQIDHINRDKRDNRWQNLRLSENHENQWNIGQQRGKRGRQKISSHKGVSYVRDRYGDVAYIIARISVNGERIYLGVFPTEEEAHAAYCRAAEHFHGEFARTS
jgi:hypothetical protein